MASITYLGLFSGSDLPPLLERAAAIPPSCGPVPGISPEGVFFQSIMARANMTSFVLVQRGKTQLLSKVSKRATIR